MDKIKRSSGIWNVIENYTNQSQEWKELKTVAVVHGLAGGGKTTLLLDYFKAKKHFYFSFAGLEENVAEKLFTQRVSAATGMNVSNWDEAFMVLSKAYRFIIFDDVASVLAYARFKDSFYEKMYRDFDSRPLVFLIVQSNDNLDGLADSFDYIEVNYLSVPDVMKLFPKLSKHDTLGLCAISGGIPKILSEYDMQIRFEENLRRMLRPDSAFCEFMPHLLEKHFRKPEIYNCILFAIANGNHRISDIGRFTGFAYNKCDNYLSSLLSAGIVKAEKEKTKSGSEKTAYTLTNFYFQLWYLYVYQNRTELVIGNEEMVERFVKGIVEKEIHAFHIKKAFAYVNHRVQRDYWASFRISDKIKYAPITIEKGSFKYSFDAIHKKGDKAVFIKVFSDPLENCKRDEFEKIQKAVTLINKYYDSHIFIFTKRRFSDYAAQQAPVDKSVSFVEVDRLKY